ncbi:hypothetical protein BX600DRAFT_295865 [Xylariales sp. PMI_506]|nr:hypothetical protein BX600DRAFT_295865 [Xylariales sp. PMI_506]
MLSHGAEMGLWLKVKTTPFLPLETYGNPQLKSYSGPVVVIGEIWTDRVRRSVLWPKPGPDHPPMHIFLLESDSRLVALAKAKGCSTKDTSRVGNENRGNGKDDSEYCVLFLPEILQYFNIHIQPDVMARIQKPEVRNSPEGWRIHPTRLLRLYKEPRCDTNPQGFHIVKGVRATFLEQSYVGEKKFTSWLPITLKE